MALRVDFSSNSSFVKLSKRLDEFKRVVAPAQAILGEGSIEIPLLSGWSQKGLNTNDPVEVASTSRLQNSALAHVASSTSKAYVGPFDAFVL